METVFPPDSGRPEEAAEPGVLWVDGQMQPSRSAHAAMSAAIHSALELVLAFVTDECADRAAQRVLLQAMAGTVDGEHRRLDRETGAASRTGSGSEVAAAAAERKAALIALRNRIAAMLDTVPATARTA